MLQIGNQPIKNDNYYIRHMFSGLDELVFEISIYDELYPQLIEEAEIVEGSNQTYLIKAIDGGTDIAKIKCQINIDDLRATMKLNYTNGSATVYNTIQGVLPSGWTCVDQAGFTFSRTITSEAATPAEIIELCRDVYGVTFRYDNKAKTVTIINADSYQPIGAFATRELNLTEINYKGKSTDFVTRLYAYGKDGLSFADINGGKPYVDCAEYTSKVICGYWSDDRYTIKENLLAAAQKMVNASGVPVRSYDCSVVDLAKTNPDMYKFQNFSLFNIVTLIDDSRKTRIDHQVVEYWEYPFMPEKNRVIMSTVPPKIQNSVKHLTEQIEKPNSELGQRITAQMQAIANVITGATGGNVVINYGGDGLPAEILIMDTPDKATAVNVMRMNMGGIAFSTSGYNGPFNAAININGELAANWITTWRLTANIITAGLLQSVDGNSYFNLDNGKIGTKRGIYNLSLESANIQLKSSNENRVWINAATIEGRDQGVVFVYGKDSSGVEHESHMDAFAVKTGNITATETAYFQKNINLASTSAILIDGSGYPVQFKQTQLSDGTNALVLCHPF